MLGLLRSNQCRIFFMMPLKQLSLANAKMDVQIVGTARLLTCCFLT